MTTPTDTTKQIAFPRYEMKSWTDTRDDCEVTDMVEERNGSYVRYSDVADLQAEVARLTQALESCERMHLPAATAAAILGHQNCMSAFDAVNKRALEAEAKLSALSKQGEGSAEPVAKENVAYFISDKWGGYWQTVREGKPYNFRLGPPADSADQSTLGVLLDAALSERTAPAARAAALSEHALQHDQGELDCLAGNAGVVERVARAMATASVRNHVDEYQEPEKWAEAADAYDLTNNNGRFWYDNMAAAALASLHPVQGEGE